MPSLGPAEILVVLVIALLVFGPDKMPEIARQAGRAFSEFRRVQQHLRSEIHGAISDLDGGGSGPSPEAAPSDTVPGGDPVPMLPPKDPDVRQPDAEAPPGVIGSVTDPPTAADPTATPPARTEPTATEATGTPPAAPDLGAATGPADPA